MSFWLNTVEPLYKVHVPMCPLYKVHLYIQNTCTNVSII